MERSQVDLKTLMLDPDGNYSPKQIRRAYLKLTLKLHPDKSGGSKEAFQELVNAFERQMERCRTSSSGPAPTTAPAPTPEHAPEPGHESWSSRDHEKYWRNTWQQDAEWEAEAESARHYDEEYEEAQFKEWRKEQARQRARNVKAGYDYRDTSSRASFSPFDLFREDGGTCSFCKTNRGISKLDAELHGLDWKAYVGHPDKYRTCWACKNSHKSVMTEKMAIRKFAKVLDTPQDGPYGEYRFFFWWLKKKTKKSFTHKPREDSRRNRYFWVPDLEEEAKDRGWKPRGAGKKKKTKKKTAGGNKLCAHCGASTHSRRSFKLCPCNGGCVSSCLLACESIPPTTPTKKRNMMTCGGGAAAPGQSPKKKKKRTKKKLVLMIGC